LRKFIAEAAPAKGAQRFVRIRYAVAGLSFLLLSGLSAAAQAAELKLLLGNALKTVMDELGPQFEKATGNTLSVTVGTTAQLKGRVDSGEAFDAVILAKPALDELAGQGKVVDSTRSVIARSGIGVAVRKGTPKPDLGSDDAFKNAMLNAKSIGYVDRTPTAAALKSLFAELGIADAMKSKSKALNMQAAVAVANGDVEIGLTQISEILPYPGVELAGPLPVDIQTYTTFAAGVGAAAQDPSGAAALIKFLAGPNAAPVIRAKGMEPG
jgi:molybdate transport system substrate-binding protein